MEFMYRQSTKAAAGGGVLIKRDKNYHGKHVIHGIIRDQLPSRLHAVLLQKAVRRCFTMKHSEPHVMRLDGCLA